MTWIIASGFCVAEALDAVEMLNVEGIYVRLIDMFTWKLSSDRKILDLNGLESWNI